MKSTGSSRGYKANTKFIIDEGRAFLFLLIFSFPIWPLKITNVVFMLFLLFNLAAWLLYRPAGYWKISRKYWFFLLPFLPYLVEYLFFPSNGIARFAMEKKTLFLLAPFFIPFFLHENKSRLIQYCLIVFAGSMFLSTIYSFTCLWLDGTLFSPSSYGQGAFILRTHFEDFSGLHPSYYSLFCVVSVMLMLKEFVKSPLFFKALILTGVVVLSGGVFLLAARMPLFIYLVSAVIFILYLHTGRQYKVMIMLAFLVVAGTFTMLSPSLRNRLSEFRTLTKTNSSPNTIDERKLISECAWVTFTNHLFPGTGSRNAQAELDSCYSAGAKPSLEPDRYNAHNQYLSIGISYGILGLLTFLFSLLKLGLTLFKDEQGRYFMLGILLAFLTESFLERQMGVYFFVLFSLYFYQKGSARLSDQSTEGTKP